VKEARRLLETVRHRRRADHMVLMGDFNSSPGSPVDRVLREEGGLVDALAHAMGLNGERLRAWSTAGFMKKRMNIDRIYASPDLEWLDFEGSRPFDEQSRGNGFAGLSDHVPIVGRARLR
jgi:endonuclease/exonuclease/phosphatase family metal-dependent hydrolase